MWYNLCKNIIIKSSYKQFSKKHQSVKVSFQKYFCKIKFYCKIFWRTTYVFNNIILYILLKMYEENIVSC